MLTVLDPECSKENTDVFTFSCILFAPVFSYNRSKDMLGYWIEMVLSFKHFLKC